MLDTLTNCLKSPLPRLCPWIPPFLPELQPAPSLRSRPETSHGCFWQPLDVVLQISFLAMLFPVLSHQGSPERENRPPSFSSSIAGGSPHQRMTRIYTIIHYMERTRVSTDDITRNPDCLHLNNIRGSFAYLSLCLIIRATDNHLYICERSDIDVACATRSRVSVECLHHHPPPIQTSIRIVLRTLSTSIFHVSSLGSTVSPSPSNPNICCVSRRYRARTME